MPATAPFRDRLVQHPIRIGRRRDHESLHPLEGARVPLLPRDPRSPRAPQARGILQIVHPALGLRPSRRRRQAISRLRRSAPGSLAIVAPAMVYSARAMTAPPAPPAPPNRTVCTSAARPPPAPWRWAGGGWSAPHQLASLAGISVLQRGGRRRRRPRRRRHAKRGRAGHVRCRGGRLPMLYRRGGGGGGGGRPGGRGGGGGGPARRAGGGGQRHRPRPRPGHPRELPPQGIPLRGIRSVSVPGLVDGWLEAHARYGRLPGHRPQPAMQLAEGGLPVSDVLAAGLAGVPQLGAFAPSQPIFWPQGAPSRRRGAPAA